MKMKKRKKRKKEKNYEQNISNDQQNGKSFINPSNTS